MHLSDGVAVITGGGSGLGEGFARHAAGLGMRIVVADIDLTAAERVARELAAHGAAARAVQVDVREPDGVDRLADEAFAFGEVRLLVNNAGVEQLGYLWDTPVESWRRVIDINVNGVFHGIRSFVPRMIATGTEGAVWNMASVAAFTTVSRQGPYIASKHAVVGITEALEVDLRRAASSVRAAVIVPAAVATGIFDAHGVVAGADAEGAREAQRSMQALLAAGTTPAEAAAEVFAQAARGEFYLRPQPERVAELMAQRASALTARSAPVERRTPAP